MQKILVICGKKQSGKSTLASYIQGNIYKNHGFIKDFKVEDGVLLQTHDKEVINLALQSSVCRQLAFAYQIKKILIDIMGLDRKQVYGTDAEKNTLTEYLWENMPGLYETQYKDRTGQMTGRDLLKYVGTEIFRKMNDKLWTNSAFRMCDTCGSRKVIFNDGRHLPEIYIGKEKYGNNFKSIRLTRNLCPQDTHDSEVAMDRDRFDWNLFDLVINNEDLNEHETYKIAEKSLVEWGWL